MALVRLRGRLKAIAGAAEVPLDAPTAGELMRVLERERPALSGWILDERGRIRRHINVFVNGEPGRRRRRSPRMTTSTSSRRSLEDAR